MANYITYFNTLAQYTAFKNSEDFVTPNVSYVEENQTLYYTGFDGSTIETNTDYNFNTDVDNIPSKTMIFYHLNTGETGEKQIFETTHQNRVGWQNATMKVNGNTVTPTMTLTMEKNKWYKVEITTSDFTTLFTSQGAYKSFIDNYGHEITTLKRVYFPNDFSSSNNFPANSFSNYNYKIQIVVPYNINSGFTTNSNKQLIHLYVDKANQKYLTNLANEATIYDIAELPSL